MFGIGGGEFILIIIIILMFFGSDKIPELARSLGKGLAQLKNATNDIKSEINNGIKDNGLDVNSLTGGISEEIDKAKQGFSKMVMDSDEQVAAQSELDKIRENFAKMNEVEVGTPIIEQNAQPKIEEGLPESDGPVKRQR